jgi:hypothetical protein
LFLAAGDTFRAATEFFCRLGSVAANTDHGRQNPANTDPKKMTPTREGKTEAVDARQHFRRALTCPLDGPLLEEVYPGAAIGLTQLGKQFCGSVCVAKSVVDDLEGMVRRRFASEK